LVHRVRREQDREGYDDRHLHRIRDAVRTAAERQPVRSRRPSRRQRLVRGERQQPRWIPERQRRHGGRDLRPDRQLRTVGNRDRTRQKSLLYGECRRQDRRHHEPLHGAERDLAHDGQHSRGHRSWAGRQPVVHRERNLQDRAAVAQLVLRDRRVPDVDAERRADRDRGRTRRRPVVHRERTRSDRPDHDRRHGERVRVARDRTCPQRDRRRARRLAVVLRAGQRRQSGPHRKAGVLMRAAHGGASKMVRHGVALATVACACVIVGCGGGGGGSVPGNPRPQSGEGNAIAPAVATPTPTPTATPKPTATPTPKPTATPTPKPTATPTPTPTPKPTATPGPLGVSTSTVQFTAAGQTQFFTATEPGFQGNFGASSLSGHSCTGIATFSPTSMPGPDATFTVTSVAAGTCVIVITDASGQKAEVTVFVTTTTGSIT